MPSAAKKRQRAKLAARRDAATHSDVPAEDEGASTSASTTAGTPVDAAPPQCRTFDAYGIVQCDRPVTDGHPQPDRCKVHHEQYRRLCKRYREASTVVDGVKDSAEWPTKEQIDRYTDWHAALEKARWVGHYLEAIRVERTGREIDEKRFFLKGTLDDGHRHRLKLLETEMVKAIDALDALQGKAYQLYHLNDALHANNIRGRSAAEVELEKQSKRSAEQIVECIRDPSVFSDWSPSMPRLTTLTTYVGDEDLIDMSLRDTKERMLTVLDPFIDPEQFKEAFVDILGTPPPTEAGMAMIEKVFFIYQRFSRRIVFHEPALFMKSLGKASFKDLVLSDDFSMEELARFLDHFTEPLVYPLKWLKDAVLDALAISHHGTAADTGDLECRFPLLGGPTFNRSHTARMSDEAWWLLLKVLQPPASAEIFFIRLCDHFDDLVGFLSFAAFGLVPSPGFCYGPSGVDPDADLGPDDPGLSRSHLSLSGIVVADMVGLSVPSQMRGPVPTSLRATRWNCVVWAEVEPRAYMFGAMRDEQDPFVDAFVRELRARPDLFQVVLRSETAPGRRVEMFGSGARNHEALPALRMRQFEAPPSLRPPSAPLSANSRWIEEWSATDVLYGSKREPEMKGYLAPERELDERYFRFKTFPVRYFVILDAVPCRDPTALARNVSWAALRAGGYAEGEYTLRKYAAAADALLERCAQKRLAWLPKEMEWKLPRMQDRMGSCTVM